MIDNFIIAYGPGKSNKPFNPFFRINALFVYITV